MGIFNVSFYFKRTDTQNYNIPFHTHKCYELVYYFSGSGSCDVGNKNFKYEKNNFVLIPPGVEHNDVHSEECKLLCIGFTLSADAPHLSGGIYSDENKNVRNHLKIIAQEFKDKHEDYLSVINNCMDNVITEIKRSTVHTPFKSLTYRDMLSEAIAYIDEYFLSEISAEQLAGITNYSYHRFRHIFKSATGVSPKQYIISKRIEHAKKLLAEGHESVTEIGYQCGFSTTSLFIRQFKEKTSLTPIQYRKQLRSDVVFSEEQSEYKNGKE